MLFFTDEQPRQTANCKPNEVEVPDLVGQPLQAARSHLVGQPLTPDIVYREAAAGQPVNIVVGQDRSEVTVSADGQVHLLLLRLLLGDRPVSLHVSSTAAARSS